MSILDCIIMLFADGILYFILTIYFDNVIQGEYGVSKPFYYFLIPSYWLEKKVVSYVNPNYIPDNIELQSDSDNEEVPPELSEKVALRYS